MGGSRSRSTRTPGPRTSRLPTRTGTAPSPATRPRPANLAGEKAWEAGFTYDWGGKTSILRVPGLWTSLLYSESWGITAVRQNVPVGKRREIDLFTVYRPPAVPGLQFRMLISNIFQEPLDNNFFDFRFIVDFELPLL